MAKSKYQDILDNPSHTDANFTTFVTNFMNDIRDMRKALVYADRNYNDFMDAGDSDNPESHYAKTMMLYGRKFCGMDVVNGISSQCFVPSSDQYDERYYYEKAGSLTPYMDTTGLLGLNALFGKYSPGFVTVEWNSWDSKWTNDAAIKNNYYRGVDSGGGGPYYPAEEKLVEKHALGTAVQMPMIRDFDGTHTNTFRLKSGYRINGWKLANGNGGGTVVYLIDDYGDDWKMNRKNASPATTKVQDRRVFSKPSENDPKGTYSPSSFFIPYRITGLYGNTSFPNSIKFILDISTPWFQIGFKAQHLAGHGNAVVEIDSSGAPASQRISTKLDEQIKLPLATMIQFDAGWEVDTTDSAYGTWTTVNPATGAVGKDAYGADIPNQEWACGLELFVGTAGNSQLDPTTNGVQKSGVWQEEQTPPIKWLYLKVRAKT